jgi:hypothetical protein
MVKEIVRESSGTSRILRYNTSFSKTNQGEAGSTQLKRFDIACMPTIVQSSIGPITAVVLQFYTDKVFSRLNS